MTPDTKYTFLEFSATDSTLALFLVDDIIASSSFIAKCYLWSQRWTTPGQCLLRWLNGVKSFVPGLNFGPIFNNNKIPSTTHKCLFMASSGQKANTIVHKSAKTLKNLCKILIKWYHSCKEFALTASAKSVTFFISKNVNNDHDNDLFTLVTYKLTVVNKIDHIPKKTYHSKT